MYIIRFIRCVTVTAVTYDTAHDMILAIDVDYQEEHNSAQIAGVLFTSWQSFVPVQIYHKQISPIAPYEAGAFYKRELPCILALLADVQQVLSCIVVDGYVFLGEDAHAGLGQHLWHALDMKIPVIGVAKNYFRGTPIYCEILRGNSHKPLYVTAVGVNLEFAKQAVQSMAGEHRIPTLLKLVDQHSRIREN